MKLFFLLLYFYLAVPLVGQAQQFEDFSLGLTTGYAYAGKHFLQVGAIYGRDYGNMHIPPMGFGLGSDVGFANDRLILAPKAFVEYHAFFLLGTRLNVINYYSNEQHDLRILPEAGITFLGYLHLMYGYGIPLSGNKLDYINRHRFSITINLLKSKY